METKHTPGPWRLQDRYSHYVIWGATKQFGYSKADITPKICEIPSDTRYAAEEMRANARLIAAAPELLEALKRIVSDYRDLRIAYNNYPGHTDDGICPSITDALVAIAKAEGR